MTIPLPLPVEIVSQSAQLDRAVQEMADCPAIALDTESNSRHRYPEKLCLIQIAARHRVHLIDTVALKDITPLKEVLANDSIRKVVHGADYDIRCLDRHYGFRIRNLYDTSIAARFAGITKFGLADLISSLLGVTIPKSERLQQADWGRRPLSAEALEYAASDVHHLIALREILDQRLQVLGRAGWAAEECARLEDVRYTPLDLENAYLGVKGAKDLDGRSLSVLRSLFLFRDEESRRQGRPPFFIIPDIVLITLAANPAANLLNVSGLGQTGLRRFGKGLQQALRDGQAAPPIQRPPIVIERRSPEQISRLSSLKSWRISISAPLSLDPSLLWPTASLERLAAAPDTLDVELTSATIRRWQRDHFASSLRTYLGNL